LQDRAFQAFTAEDLLEHFRVNTIVLTPYHLLSSPQPAFLLVACIITLFLPALANSHQGPFLTAKHLTRSLAASPWGGRILNISSDTASIRDNTGGNLPYRLSKTALNQLTATIAAEGSRPSLFQDNYAPMDDSGPVMGVGNIIADGGGGSLTAISVDPGYKAHRDREEMERCVDGIVGLVERLCESENGGKKGRGRELVAGGFYRWDGGRLAF
jgi:hypothetical protein